MRPLFGTLNCRFAGRGAAIGPPHQHRAAHDERRRQNLPHRDPAEDEIAELHVWLAHEFEREAEQAVQQQDQKKTNNSTPTNKATKSNDKRRGSGPPVGKIIAQGTSLILPHNSPLMKLPMRPAQRPMGTSGAVKSAISKKCL